MVEVTVKKRGAAAGKEQKLAFPSKAANQVSVKDLKREIARAFKISTVRQRLTAAEKGEVLSEDAKTLDLYGIFTPADVVLVKDLGPQISWTTVFLVEYLGPILIHPLVFFLAPRYFDHFTHSKVQIIGLILVLLHFIKRELETLFVHRFSNATMPLMNIFKNSAHYWILSGMALAVPLYGPWHSQETLVKENSIRLTNEFLYLCVGVWLFAEVSNFLCHWNLANLRPAGSKKRVLPKGYGFDIVSVPNYTFEIIGWLAFSVMTGEIAAYGFSLISTMQMTQWALKKHQNYKREFPEMPKSRKAIFPGIL